MSRATRKYGWVLLGLLGVALALNGTLAQQGTKKGAKEEGDKKEVK